MRHYFSFGSLARTPLPAAGSVFKTPGKATLVALTGLHLQLPSALLGAPICAIDLAMVAIAADQNLRAAAGANKKTGRDFRHEYLWQTKGVLDGGRPRMQQSSRTRYKHGEGRSGRIELPGKGRRCARLLRYWSITT